MTKSQQSDILANKKSRKLGNVNTNNKIRNCT